MGGRLDRVGFPAAIVYSLSRDDFRMDNLLNSKKAQAQQTLVLLHSLLHL